MFEIITETAGCVRELDAFGGRIKRGPADPIIARGMAGAGDEYLWFTRRRYLARSVSGWPPLAPSTRRQKSRQGTLQKGTLIETERMFQSLMPGLPFNVRRVTPAGGEFGSMHPNLKFHQEGTKRMPRREVLVDPTSRARGEMDAKTTAAIDRLIAIVFPGL